MKLYLRLVGITILLCITLKGHTQCTTPVSTCTLNSLLTPGDYKARDKVSAVPGTQAHPIGTQKMHLFIDENIVLETSYNNSPPVAGSYTINTSLPVGAIAGNAAVSQTGAVTYSIPVFIPPGTAGMQPSVSIVYNSQGGSGLLGTGWDISGSSAIIRTGQNVYYNGNINPVILNVNDGFALDGNRLIYDGGYFHTEIETFSKILPYGTAGNGPAYFTVTTKDGKELEYGYSTDSKYIPQGYGNATVLLWKLYKVTDCNGNYMTYTYRNQNGENVLDKIDYTGTGSFNPYNSIKFLYDSRADQNFVNVAGFNIPQRLLLRSIKSMAEGQIIRQYDFEYFCDNVTGSHLSKVTETGKDGTQLNATSIIWNQSSQVGLPDPNNNSGQTTLGQVPGSNFANTQVYGDYNGDGFTDILVVHKKIINNGNLDDDGKTWLLYLNNYGTGYTYVATGEFPEGYEDYVVWGSEFNAITSVDVNADGKEDLIIPVDHFGDKFIALTSTGNDFFNQSNVFAIPLPYGFLFYPDHGETIGDFDGDGSTDIFVYYYPNETWYIHNWRTGVTKTGTMSLGGSSTSFNSVDFDGDGKSEILLTYNGTSSYGINDYNSVLKLNTVTGGLDLLSHGAFPSSCEGEYRDIYPGDFNGDGKTDFLAYNWCSPQNVGSWQMGYSENTTSTGTSIQYLSSMAPFNYENPNDYPIKRAYLVADYNGDGKSDIAMVEKITGFSPAVIIYYSLGNYNFYQASPLTLPDLPDISLVRVGDYNGDGHSDLIYPGVIDNNGGTGQTCHAVYFKCSGNNGTTPEYDNYNKVTAITNGLNQTTYIEYNTLPELAYKGSTGSNESYLKANGSQFPLMDLQQPIPVVSKLMTDDGSGGKLITKYKYEGAVAHLQGKGLLCFYSMTVENINSGIKIKTGYTPQLGIFYPTMRFIYTYQAGNLLSSLVNSNLAIINTTANVGAQAFFVNYLTSTSIDNLTLKNSVATNYINADGNLSSSSVESWVDNSPATYHILKTTNNTYEAYCGWGIPNRIKSTSVTQTYGSQPPYTRSVSYNYVSSNGNLNDQVTDEGVTTHYDYNASGLPTVVTVSANGLLPVSNSFEYDSKLRFVTKTTNPALDESFKSYNNDGTLASETDITGLSTLNFYDGFSQLIRIHTPQLQEIVTTRNWNTSPGLLFDETVVAPGRPVSKTFYDLLGRAVATQVDGYNSTTINTAKVYNNLGLLTQESKPFYNGGTPKWIEYSYDTYNRVIGINDGNKTIVTSFDIGSKITTSTAGVANTADTYYSEKNYDADGNLILAIDHGGAINYTYGSHGNPVTINASGTVTTLVYSPYGRQSSLTDPDAGPSTYEYNAYGQLTKQVDGNGNIYDHFVYNSLGGLDSKKLTPATGSNISTYAYVYNSSGNGKRMLHEASVTDPTAIVAKQTYEYDKYCNTISFTNAIAGSKSMTTLYHYNQFGDLDKQTYPSGFITENHYDTKGYLQSITSPAVATGDIWHLINENALGQPTDIEFGTKHTEYGYDLITDYLTSIYTLGFQNQNLSFGFDAVKGNLNYRSRVGYNEDFTYDNLNRLSNISINWAPPSTTLYQVNGNITSKPDAGTYTYNPTSIPHAVRRVNASPNPISINEQKVIYTPFTKVKQISENNLLLNFTYGPDQQRIKTVLQDAGGTILKTKYFTENYEEVITAAGTKKITYITAPNGLAAVYIDEGSSPQLYYVLKDHLGCITALINGANGNIQEEYFYDAWGRRCDQAGLCYTSLNTPTFLIERGYTGQEHLDEFGLINLNGRLYDPILGRMLSPDNYVQAPGNSQSYNRYSYCFNNPLRYTDPDGNWSGTDDLIVGGIGFALGYVSYGLTNKDWGWHAAVAGGISAGSFLLGYYTLGSTSAGSIANGFSAGTAQGCANTVGLAFAGKTAAAAALSSFMPSVTLYHDNNFSLSVSPTFSLQGIGASLNATYSNGDWAVSEGFGMGLTYGQGVHPSAGGGISYYDGDFGAGYSLNAYGGGESQRLGQLSLKKGDWGLNVSNDLGPGADGGDRWRTGAGELSYLDFSAGFLIHTGDPGAPGTREKKPGGGKAKEIYTGGTANDPALRAGICYFGYKNYRLGWNSERIRHAIQDIGIHDNVVKLFTGEYSPWFDKVQYNPGPYFNINSINPYSMWGHY